jgi:hypothetical protein
LGHLAGAAELLLRLLGLLQSCVGDTQRIDPVGARASVGDGSVD